MAIYLAATSTDAVIMFGWLIVIVFLLRYLNRVADRKASVLRVQILLKCTKGEALAVNRVLRTKDIPWMTFLSWTNAALGKLMPMFNFDNTFHQGDSQVVATWDEVKRAILSITLSRKVQKRWSDDDAIAAVVLEVMNDRRRRGVGLFMPNTPPASFGGKL